VVVSILEALVIYLSVGAPFGVLRFFSGLNEQVWKSWLFAAIAVLLWPWSAIKQVVILLAPASRSWSHAGGEPSLPDPSLFVISGHPHPELAAICYQRARRKVILGRSFGNIADISETRHTAPTTTNDPHADDSQLVPAMESSTEARPTSLTV
jgi:hypothetical protein